MKEKENINENKQKLESKDLKTGTNTKEIKLDSHGDEIVYEVRHRLGISDTIQYIIMFMFGIALVYVGIRGFVLADRMDGVMFAMLLGIPCVFSSFYRLFCARKNRFYVTNNGIGFERRKWFRMQKRFFEFGEVNIFFGYIGSTDGGSGDIFIIYPFNKLRIKRLFFLPKDYIKITIYPSASMQDILHLITFIRKRTKEALKAKGIHITDSELKEKIKSYIKNKDI